MAIPIKETPVLRGKAAREFKKRIESAPGKAVPKEDYRRAEKIYRKFQEKNSLPI